MTFTRLTALLVAGFAAVAAWYSVAVPVFEANDEPGHYEYVRYLREQRALPVLTADGRDSVAGQEGAQPPLYYALGALATAGIDQSKDERWLVPNPHHSVDRESAGNKNALAHTDRERFPWSGTLLAIHVVRLVSVALGAATVAFTVLAAREAGLRPAGALTVGAVVAANPQFIFQSAVLNSDNAIICASAAAFWLGLRLVQRGPSNGLLIAAGAVAGLGTISKLSGPVLVPLVVLAWWLGRRPGRSMVADITRITAPAALIGGWWYLRNLLTYGDLLGWQRMLLAIDYMTRPRFDWGEFAGELRSLLDSSWAIFGWRNVPVDDWIYLVIDGMLVLAIAGLLIDRCRPAGAGLTGRVALLSGAWVGAFSLALLRWILIAYNTGQGRLLFPALPAVALVIVVGLSRFGARWPAPAVLLAGLSLLTVIAPFRYIAPAYASATRITDADLAAAPNAMRARFGDVVELRGYQFAPEQVRPGGTTELTLWWQGGMGTTDDLDVDLRVLAADYRPIDQQTGYPAAGAYPFAIWSAGDRIRDRWQLSIPSDVQTPDYLRIEVSIHPRGRPDQAVAVVDGEGRPLGDRLTIGPLRLPATSAWPPAGTDRVSATLPSGMQIDGVRMNRSISPPGVSATLYWTARERLTVDRQVTLDLIDSAGRLVASTTGDPGDGWYRTSLWQPGDRIVDERWLPVMLPPGEYALRVRLSDAPISASQLIATLRVG